MSLITESLVTVAIMTETRTEDGEGGYTASWEMGSKFKAAFTHDQSVQAKVAEKQGVRSNYTITFPKNVVLNYHDILCRVSDGKWFRVTSDGEDKYTPERANFGQYRQVTAEEWEEPS